MSAAEAIQVTAEEMFESLTGFEEIAVEKHFDTVIENLAETKQITYMRALVFVAKTREGLSGPDAKSAALGLTIKEVTEFFADDEDEPMPEEPITESGKGERRPPVAPVSLPPSVS